MSLGEDQIKAEEEIRLTPLLAVDHSCLFSDGF